MSRSRYTRPSSYYAPAPPVHPDNQDVVGIADMRQTVHLLTHQHEPANTRAAYEPKVKEYREFCDHRFAHLPADSKYTVTSEKLYRFLFYQAFRKKRKKRKRNSFFDKDEYEDIMSKYASITSVEEVHLENPVEWSTVNTYHAAVKRIWDEQVSRGVNIHSWDHVHTQDVTKVLDWVKNRKHRIRKENYTEKLDHELAPYKVVEDVGKIEEEMWNRGQVASIRNSLSWLRNRMCFLFSFAGILRCESMFHAELSDMLHTEINKNSDPSTLLVCILQLAFGKYSYNG